MDEIHRSASAASSRKRSDELKDEVYRNMFRLEERRLGAERDLAVALLRAWVAMDSLPRSGEAKKWLQKICPICLSMIEASQQSGEQKSECVQSI